MQKSHLPFVLALVSLATPVALGQIGAASARILANQRIQVSDLQLRAAQSDDQQLVLSASLETIFADNQVCCGKNSALEDTVLSADPNSLQDVGRKLEGRHYLDDGRPFTVHAEYFRPDSAKPEQIIAALTDNKPLLMQWNSEWYVVRGAVFNEKVYAAGIHEYAIRKLLLLDARPPRMQRKDSFRAEKDDWHAVQGLLLLTVGSE